MKNQLGMLKIFCRCCNNRRRSRSFCSFYRQNSEPIGDIQDNKKPTDEENDEIEKPVEVGEIFKEASGGTEDLDA